MGPVLLVFNQGKSVPNQLGGVSSHTAVRLYTNKPFLTKNNTLMKKLPSPKSQTPWQPLEIKQLEHVRGGENEYPWQTS
ncbi:MAG TPA: hypothetical protein DCE41_15305 [Cytophagales bacterium]|nr:hypothetical protein [Cytophagales bacterium]HAA23023.1 hypothetical protein [Cytophagales bacterium]HAP59165.1 hypothetical protein [Cytophagales bacterium]